MSESDSMAAGPAGKRTVRTTNAPPAAPSATSASPTAGAAAAAKSPARPKGRRRSIKGRARMAQMREAAKRGSAAAARGRQDAPRSPPAGERPDPPSEALDPLEAAQEAARHAQEGNLKLSQALETLRTGLEGIAYAETDRKTGLPVEALALRRMAVEALDKYSGQVGQNWRKVKLTGPTLAGKKGNKPVHEAQMGMPPQE